MEPAIFKELTDSAFKVVRRKAVRTRAPRAVRDYSGNGARGDFDVRNLLDRARVGYTEAQKGSVTLFHLHECPIDNSHDKGTSDTTVFEDVSGKLGFKCQHDRCQGHDWHSARKSLEGMAT